MAALRGPTMPKAGKDLWDAMRAAYEAGNGQWVETTERVYDEQLNVLPPRAWIGPSFAVGEEYCHNEYGLAVWPTFTHRDGRYFGRYATLTDFRADAKACNGSLSIS